MGFSSCNLRAQQLERARLVALQHVGILVLQPGFEPMTPALEGKFLTTGPQKCLQFSSVAQLCPTLCGPMNRSTPGLPVHHQLPELAQTHVHRVSDAIQSSHPVTSPSPPAFNVSQRQHLFQSVSSSHRWPKYWSFGFSISPSNKYCILTHIYGI